jgi:hypothetical protein
MIARQESRIVGVDRIMRNPFDAIRWALPFLTYVMIMMVRMNGERAESMLRGATGVVLISTTCDELPTHL